MATAVRVISCVSWRKLGNFKKTQNGKKPHPGTTFIHICCINLVKERVGNIIAPPTTWLKQESNGLQNSVLVLKSTTNVGQKTGMAKEKTKQRAAGLICLIDSCFFV